MRITARFISLPLMCVTTTAFWLRPWKGLHFSRVGPIMRSSQGFLGTGETGHLFQGNREQRPNFEGNRGTTTILRNREHMKTNFRYFCRIFGEQGNKPIYFRGTREQVPPWEGLNYFTWFSTDLSITDV